MGNLVEKNNLVLRSLGYHLRQIRQQKQLRKKQLLSFVKWIVEVIPI